MKPIRAAIQLVGTSTSNSGAQTSRLTKIPLRRYPKKQCQIFTSDAQVTLYPRSQCLTRSISSQSRSYTTSVMNQAQSPSRPPPAPQNKLRPSFKIGPYSAAILIPKPKPATLPPSTPISHPYTPSKLREISKPRPLAPSSFATLHFPHSDTIKQHLEELLYPLQFSDQLACRMVSAKNLIKSQASLDELKMQRGDVGYASVGEHYTKLGFFGRRLMHFALSDFLMNAPLASPLTTASCRLSAQVVEDALLTKFVLGQYVGSQWELEKIIRWRELAGAAPGTRDVVGTGLWFARGHAVEAIIGGIMVQHGTRLSLAVFNSLVLPHLAFRLDPAYVPAIKAIQQADRELERPEVGLAKWKELDLAPFLVPEPAPEKQAKQKDQPPLPSP